jgi:acetylornithine/N-succinyldiaminopimelate aminotransferase
MAGVELRKEGGDIMRKMLDRGIMANVASMNVIRFVPPLIISREELQKAVDVLKMVLDEEGS